MSAGNLYENLPYYQISTHCLMHGRRHRRGLAAVPPKILGGGNPIYPSLQYLE